jgi:hypothetical protein
MVAPQISAAKWGGGSSTNNQTVSTWQHGDNKG